MAQNNDDWNSFMQGRPMRILLNGICAACCGYYAVGGVMELFSPGDTSLLLIERVGTMGFYALTAVRTLVCAWVAVVFARMTVKAIRDEE